jgi:outer membrane protein TolC
LDATKSIQFGTKWSQTAGITVIQPLLDQTIRRQIIEAKLQERMAAATQAQSEYELAYTVAQTYIEISLQQAKIESAIADTARTFISYNLLKNKFDEKRLLKSDLNKSIINHNNTRQLLSDAVAELITDKVYLLFLTGQANIEQPDIIIDTGFFNIQKILPANTNPDFELIPEFQQLELEGQLKSIQAKSEKAKYLPTLSLKGFIGANQYTNNFDPVAANSWFGLSYVGIDVKLPLLFGEDKKKKLQQLQLQASQYHLQEEEKAAQYSKDVVTAKINMGQLAGQLKTQEENLLLTNESIVIMQARVLEGQESASNLNLEEANLQQLQSTHETSKRQLWLYWLDYQKASGRLGLLWK